MPANYRHHISGVNSGSTITIDPATLTHVSGDGLLLIVMGYTSLGNPSGGSLSWTAIGSDTQAAPFSNTAIMGAWKAYSAGGTPTSFTVANGAADQYAWCLMSLSDVDGSDFCPTNWWGYLSNVFSTDAEPDSPSLSTGGTPGTLVAACGVWPQNNATSSFSPPTGMTEQVDLESWDSFSVATLASPGDPTGARAWTESPGLTDNSAWIAGAFAIKSSSSGTAHSQTVIDAEGLTDAATTGSPHTRTVTRVVSTHTG